MKKLKSGSFHLSPPQLAATFPLERVMRLEKPAFSRRAPGERGAAARPATPPSLPPASRCPGPAGRGSLGGSKGGKPQASNQRELLLLNVPIIVVRPPPPPVYIYT